MHVVTSATSDYAMDHPALATLSAVRYIRADQIVLRDRWTSEVTDDRPVDTLFYNNFCGQYSLQGRKRHQDGERENDEYRTRRYSAGSDDGSGGDQT
jgi:hypothetical protein